MDNDRTSDTQEMVTCFFDRPGVKVEEIPVGEGVPFGLESVTDAETGIGGAYGTWGQCYDNEAIHEFVSAHMGRPLTADEKMELGPLGFERRHHVPKLSAEDNLTVELNVGARLLEEAIAANGWRPGDVDGLLIGMSAPICEDYLERISAMVGIRESAVKVNVHKACDSSVGALHMALNPDLPAYGRLGRNLAQELLGKRVLVGGIEGLSRFMKWSYDTAALQIFGTGAGVVGVVPGQTMEFIVGREHEAYDQKGLLAVSMYYPHSRRRAEGEPFAEVTQSGENQFRVAGLMHEPENGAPLLMAGPMGMVKLFVRTGVQVVKDVVNDYRAKMESMGIPGKDFAVTIAHHANYKINALKGKHLEKQGISLSIPWVIRDFGNVSAASNMIAFLRQLPQLRPGDHILIDGFGAGTYYDVLAVALGRAVSPAG